MRKNFILTVIVLLVSAGCCGLVFGSSLVFGADTRFVTALSDTVYTDNPTLSKTILVYQSNLDISGYNLSSSCKISTRFLTSEKSLYFFEVDYAASSSCSDRSISLAYNNEVLSSTKTNLEIKNKMNQFALYIDYSDSDLARVMKTTHQGMKKYSIYKNYNRTDIVKNYKYLKGQRLYTESLEQKKIIDQIIEARKKKYITPVAGKVISTKAVKMPNTARPYRASYTDGIHHGWDIDAPLGHEVQALDDGFIVRIVNNFSDSDFNRIVYTSPDTMQKLKNLDILRWNQVWLKTMKGEVVFYSHLGSVSAQIKEGMYVSAWEILGKIGVSGVPETGYDDYHLHFAVMKNPYKFETAGLYDFWDYMSWDWVSKWLSQDKILTLQKTIFE